MRLPVFGRVARVALRRRVRLDPAMVSEAGTISVGGRLGNHFPREVQVIRYTVRIITVDRYFPEVRLIRGSRKNQTARSCGSSEEERMSGNAME